MVIFGLPDLFLGLLDPAVQVIPMPLQLLPLLRGLDDIVGLGVLLLPLRWVHGHGDDLVALPKTVNLGNVLVKLRTAEKNK